jgi:L-2-hydroxyglutarate oxidase LhgO
MERLDAVVIGAGVVGLAVARALAMAGREVVILEAEDAIGTHTSSRNSEVIHAGIYYPKGSLKARSCVAGKALLYEYCVTHGVPHQPCGKLIVATDEKQISELENIQKKAHGNGVTDVVWMSRSQALALEPELACVAALYSPSTGIIDSHALMLAYLGDAEDRGEQTPSRRGSWSTARDSRHRAWRSASRVIQQSSPRPSTTPKAITIL